MVFIDKERTKAAIRKYADTKHNNGEQIDYVNGILKSISVINEQPTADVEEVKHGEWIIENSERDWKDKDTYRLFIKCSECGKTHFLGTTKYQNEYDKEKLKRLGTYADYSYCGKCGAKMDR